jgi:RNA polymerase sigma-70 factor, ECF subfamily
VSERLVEQARRGDADAFVALIEERQVTMTRVASAILGNPADVADALQETLLSLWRDLPSLRSVDAFPAWADRILVNACRLVLRRRGRTRLREIALPEDQGSLRGIAAGGSPAPFDRVVAEREAFDRAFDRLEPAARAILVLHHLEDRSLAEISAVFAIPVGTAKSRLFKARRDLEAALALEESSPVSAEPEPDRP